MAKQTRQGRRERRGQGSPEPTIAQRAQTRRQNVRPAAQPQKTQGGGRRRVPGTGTKRFVGESWAELKKVEWPGQSQVIQGTVVVLVACFVVGVFLYVNDLVWKHVVQNVFLGQ